MFRPSVIELCCLLAFFAIVMFACVRTGKLTARASLAGGLTGLLVFAGTGYTGLLMLGAFFILGTLATSHQKEKKRRMNRDGVHQEARNTGQVLANGGVAALMGVLSVAGAPHAELYLLMAAASLASATADTLSSELGMVYGRNTFNILTLRKEPAGLDGVVSLEGTLIGAAGAGVIAVIYSLPQGFGSGTLIIIAAGVLGNLADSLLGAALERRHYIGNDAVNFLNTLMAAVAALLLYLLV